jgi:hypothetical protein
MEQISEEIWTQILNNQRLPLIGTNEPNNGNGYHDGISWQVPFHSPIFKHKNNEELYYNTFRTIYLRDLGNDINFGEYLQKNQFKDGLKIINCSDNYKNTLEKYLSVENHYRNDFFHELSEWGKIFAYKGRLIFEIISWFDNLTNQFYAFQLRRLDIDYCKVKKNYVVYKTPFKQKGDKTIFNQVQIPKNKCVIIDFPSEYGGYKIFVKKDKSIMKLGNQFGCKTNPYDVNKKFAEIKNWNKQYHKIISGWGSTAFTQIEDVSEFYKESLIFRNKYLIVCCTHEILNGLQQLVNHLNEKLCENATIEFTVQQYDKNYFKSVENKWLKGKLSFKEANEFLRKY